MKETHSKHFFSSQQCADIPASMRPILIADGLSTPENIGHLIRLGANIGVNKVLAIMENDLRKSKIRKTAGTAYDHIITEYIKREDLLKHLPNTHVLTALETAPLAVNIFDQSLPANMALVVGNEKHGIHPGTLKLCKHTVYIPMSGPVKSMNVSHAAAVCLFQWYREYVHIDTNSAPNN
jgi:tRNA G18 (ribose-2'-O)-methylase SpoU